MDKEGAIGLLVAKPKDEEGSGDSRKTQAKAMFKALQKGNFDDFYEALCMILDDKDEPAMGSGDDEE
ncbi:MAG: hypothetical protein QM778_33205 [Myxococcales bacterium]